MPERCSLLKGLQILTPGLATVAGVGVRARARARARARGIKRYKPM
jgi:hypothetical protein